MLMKRYETRTTASRFGWEPAAHTYWVVFTAVYAIENRASASRVNTPLWSSLRHSPITVSTRRASALGA